MNVLRSLGIALLAATGLVLAPSGFAQPVSASSSPADVETDLAAAKAAMLIDPTKANALAVDAEQKATGIADPLRRDIAVASARWLQGESLLRTGDNSRAAELIQGALKTADRLAPLSKLKADILLSRGGAETAVGKVGAALVDYQSAFALYRKLRDERGQAMALLFIAWLYTEAMDQNSALKYYKQALSVYRSDPSLSVSIYNNRATAFSEMKLYAQAMNEFKSAMVLAKSLRSGPLQAQIYVNIALLKLEQGDVGGADQALDNGFLLIDGNTASGMRAGLTAVAARLALRQGRVADAVARVSHAFAEMGTGGTSISPHDMHQIAYDVFLAAGDTRAALTHLQSLKRLDDNATRLATSTQTALMAARFDFANQELKISQLRAQELRRGIAAERARAQTQRYIFLGAGGAVAIVIGALAFGIVALRRSRDRIRAANDDLAITNGALGKALAARTEFLATTSHEIRTPLNGILGMTQVMLADATMAPDLRGRLNVVHDAGVTMRALVDDILDVAKMEAGNLTIEAAPFDVCATVTDAARMWEEQARAKGLTFDVVLEGCPALIVGDAARMRQIVFNLLSNALKFTKSGRVSLAVNVGHDDRLCVVVSDSGIGIPADKFEEIFESFRQADAGTTRQFGGTGLGLAICRNLARAMGGDVVVDSVLGQGTTFTLTLPLVRAAPVESAAIPDEGDAVTLVLDRNPITRSMFRTLLSPDFDPVLCVVSFDDAIARLAAGNVARMLIDDATIIATGDHLAALKAIVALAGRGDVETTLLWPATSDLEDAALLATGVTRVITRPVSGGTLMAAMGTSSVAKKDAILDLVPRAA